MGLKFDRAQYDIKRHAKNFYVGKSYGSGRKRIYGGEDHGFYFSF